MTVKLNFLSVRVLVDTGAVFSFISQRVVTKLKAKVEPLRPTDAKQFFGADGNPIDAIGRTEIMVNLNGLSVPEDFIVLPKLREDALIGTNFLNTNRATIDFSSHVITFEDGLVALNLVRSADKHRFVRVNNMMVLPPMSESLVEIRTPPSFNSKPCIVESRPGFQFVQFATGRSLVKPNKGLAYCTILNHQRKPITLRRNQVVGQIDHCSNLLFDVLPNDITVQPSTTNIHTITTQSTIDAETMSQPSDEECEQLVAQLGIDISPKLTPEQRRDLLKLIHKYRSVFATKHSQITGIKGFELDIPLKQSAKPVFIRQFRQSQEAEKLLDDKIRELIDAGLLEKSTSEWNSPVFVIKKRNGTGVRFLQDLRKVNSQILLQPTVLPNIDQMLDEIAAQKCAFLSSFDLFSGYFQLKLNKKSRELTAFTTRNFGRLQYRVLAQGLTLAPRAFMDVMTQF